MHHCDALYMWVARHSARPGAGQSSERCDRQSRKDARAWSSAVATAFVRGLHIIGGVDCGVCVDRIGSQSLMLGM
jgi:hypothetical protein